MNDVVALARNKRMVADRRHLDTARGEPLRQDRLRRKGLQRWVIQGPIIDAADDTDVKLRHGHGPPMPIRR
jgi:hypothetical protein